MEIKELQNQVDCWIKKHGVRYFDEMTNLAVLMEEVGELSRVLSREYGEQSYKKGAEVGSLADEMADILFVLTCLANQTGVDLEDAMKMNFAKKTLRDGSRHHENDKLS
ncbi:MAG: NTP pyrophosphatase (non-canonical NTP hydrolase) [Glaciecola sp.]|jgi:NTP pyrophosphatase (non-canonical NTP hydrolase)